MNITLLALIIALSSTFLSGDTSAAVLAADPLPVPSLADSLIEKGWPGIVILVLLLVVRQLDARINERDAAHKAAIKEKDDALKAERDARLADAQAYRDTVIKVNEKVHESVEAVVRVVEYLEKK